jgi:hypothetical protein
MKRNDIDTANPDFIWNRNRFHMEREAIKK